MKTLLICHHDSALTQHGMSRWLGSFSDLVGVIVIKEDQGRIRERVRREFKRVGALRFLDVLAFRAYYRLFMAGNDNAWERARLKQLQAAYPDIPADTPVLRTHSPNSPAAAKFIRSAKPDIMVARIKTLLKETIFSIPGTGTFVMHPGICPEYRNAHGCFWALANNDPSRVGMTLLRVDKGVDTGPVFGFFYCRLDEANESHVVIQHRTVYDNLDALRDKLIAIHGGVAAPIDISNRRSATWGQPWLTCHLRWKRNARRAAA